MSSEVVQSHRDVHGLIELREVQVLKQKIFEDIFAARIAALAAVVVFSRFQNKRGRSYVGKQIKLKIMSENYDLATFRGHVMPRIGGLR